MTHYICTGDCGGVAENPQTCQAMECGKYQEPLESCDCHDGKHGGLADENQPGKEDEE